jgi:dienelactone hydrolase
MRLRRSLAVALALCLLISFFPAISLAIHMLMSHSGSHLRRDRMIGFDHFPFETSDHRTIQVYFTPPAGPPVLLLHELPGMTPECVRFARDLSREGFTVFMPLLFGRAGCRLTTSEFTGVLRVPGLVLFADRTSPLAVMLLPLVDEIHRRRPGNVGVMGMCLTGNFPLVLLQNRWVRAAVLSQPAVPLPLVIGRGGLLGLCRRGVKAAQKRGIPIRVFRFTTDAISPAARLATLKRTFAGQIQIHPVFALSGAHSVFTDQYEENRPETAAAFQDLIRFLRQTLAEPGTYDNLPGLTGLSMKPR